MWFGYQDHSTILDFLSTFTYTLIWAPFLTSWPNDLCLDLRTILVYLIILTFIWAPYLTSYPYWSISWFEHRSSLLGHFERFLYLSTTLDFFAILSYSLIWAPYLTSLPYWAIPWFEHHTWLLVHIDLYLDLSTRTTLDFLSIFSFS